MSHELVLVLDFGGQYNQLIARRVREHKIYCEVKSYKTPIEEIRAMNPKGIIFTGGPNSVYLENSPRMSKEIFDLGVPVLGICYGVQFMAYALGGEIGTAVDSSLSEFGRTETEVDTSSLLFKGIDRTTVTWMSHNDYIKKLPEGFEVCGHTAKCPYAAIQNVEKKFYGVQFHPEVNHTERGFDMLGNFLYNVCECRGDWTMESYAETAIRNIREKAKKIGKVDYLVQGTIYPDVIESGLGDAAVIKSHHNVGGLPDYVDFKEIIEPLRLLFKDEVRALGTTLGLDEKLVWRQPFPGPGLAIRIIGDITPEKVATLQDADAIFREEIANAGLDRSINQYFAVLTNMRSVGVMGDGRTYDYTLALRGVSTSDFMTADFSRIPYDVLEKVSVRIVNEVKNINRIVYDITSKPPATIEWE